ncbi:hypothetical protein BDP27DRAFT_1428576 [Rhodocollybia butyracea]|uniref:Uncharacterized protein n=1 Tax=Rhodocollybia butyracea TaxID=206335 RepID=A0A9P5PEA0_9AGAR|nr:hypothetical protein BDP27DRAFT_1428576 [Rhodocollybia butyracea]
MTSSQIPLDRAYLTAIWLETLFYGINMLLFFSYLFIVKYKRKYRLSKIIITVAVLMFLFSTTHVSLGFYRLIEGFIVLRDAPGGPSAFFSDVSIPANVAKVTLHTVNSVFGDSIMVWRCYNVWGQKWLPSILPILLIIASAVCGFGQAVIFAQAKSTHSAFSSQLEIWNGSLFSLSLTTNVVVTSLIAFRIWWLSREVSPLHESSFKYRRVLTLVIESGAVYSSALVIEITLYFLNNNAFYIIYDPIAQLTAIVPTTIIVMTSLGLTSNDLNSEEKRTTKNRTNALESRPQFARIGGTDNFSSTIGSLPEREAGGDREEGNVGFFLELKPKDPALVV